MELFENLATIGLTAKVLQFIIIGGIAIFLIGMFWQYIVVGAGILFCVVVFAMPSGKVAEEVKQVEQKVVSEVKQIESPPIAEVKPNKPQTDEEMFLEDCNLHSGYTSAQCKALWESDKEEIQKSNWKYKNNKSYMKKVKHGV